MASPLDKLESASFKGFPFLVDVEKETELGRKISIYKFPNSNKQYAQDSGLNQPTYEVEAVIHGPQFLDNTEQFKRVLDSKGKGQLVLPHLGSLEVVALPYNVDYDFKAIGVVRFTLKFVISNTEEVPALASSSISDVYQTGDEMRLLMQTKLPEKFKKPSSFQNFLSAVNDVRRAVVDTVTDVTGLVSNYNDKLQKIVRDIETDLIKVIRDPQELAKRLIYGNIALANGLMATISALYSGTLDNFDELVNLFRKPSVNDVLNLTHFGEAWSDSGAILSLSKIALWEPNTAERIERNDNRVAIVETVRMNSLIWAYEAAANLEYTTVDEIEAVIVSLDTAYITLVQSGDINLIWANDNEFMALLDRIRALCYRILSDRAQQAYSTSTLDIQGTSSVMGLSYRLYAEAITSSSSLESFAEAMVLLNQQVSPLEFMNTINIYEVE